MKRLKVYWGEDDISADIELANGKASPYPSGWSCYDLVYADETIGLLYCGFVRDMREGFTAKVVEEPEAA